MARKKSVLVDGNNALYHYYDPLSTLEHQGVPCGAVDGLLRLLQRMDETHAPEHICVMFDSKDRVTTRQVMQPSYKGDRRPTPASLVPQFAQAKAALQKRHVNCIEWPGVEADDLIASYATQYTATGFDVLLISNDNDFLQLVRGEDRGTTATATAATVATAVTTTDVAVDLVATAPAAPVVELYQPSKRRYIRERSLRGRFGLDPKLLPDFHALCGHQWKHLPRVDNLTDEVAVQLLTQYGGLYSLLRQLDALEDPALCTTLKQGISAIEGSYRIVKLIDSVALPVAIEDLQRPQWT